MSGRFTGKLRHIAKRVFAAPYGAALPRRSKKNTGVGGGGGGSVFFGLGPATYMMYHIFFRIIEKSSEEEIETHN